MQQNRLQKAGVPDLFAHFSFAVSGGWTSLTAQLRMI
jgi:hypothetical protein